MIDFKFGKGIIISDPRAIDRGDASAIAARLEAAGVQTAVLKIADGTRVLDRLEGLVGALRDRSIQVGGWGASQLDRAPIKEAGAALKAFARYEPDFYLIRVGARVERKPSGARLFLDELRKALPAFPMGLQTFGEAGVHPRFPWTDLLSAVDFVCPSIDLRGDEPVGRLSASRQSYEEMAESMDVPMPAAVPEFGSSRGFRPTPQLVTELLTAANEDPFLHGLIVSLGERPTRRSELWEAFAAYQWNDAAREVPSQPIGWAQIKVADGAWIHSSPDGARLSALARGELVPIWLTTATDWGALNEDADRWIFLGQSDQVQTTMDLTPAALPRTAVPELFQARVATRRGLNVRDAVRGRVLRALSFNALVRVYEARDGWARISPFQPEWVSVAYLHRLTA